MPEEPTEGELLDALSDTPRSAEAVAAELSADADVVHERLSALETDGRALATEEGWIRRSDTDTDELLNESARRIHDRLGRDPRR
ncbi:DprA-like winged helix domain-containing protein [Natronorarus salvus]|uniref:DprA-like winged helix domain-containing protein n=1 Tax=Natronorarus salvus TaxID=3117733 RepID=UPI002F265F24